MLQVLEVSLQHLSDSSVRFHGLMVSRVFELYWYALVQSNARKHQVLQELFRTGNQLVSACIFWQVETLGH